MLRQHEILVEHYALFLCALCLFFYYHAVFLNRYAVYFFFYLIFFKPLTNCCLLIDIGTDFEEDSFTIDCPSGCVEDLSSGNVYGTTIYTEVREKLIL